MISVSTRGAILGILLIATGCASRAPSLYVDLTPVQARALSQKMSQDRDEVLADDLHTAFAGHPPQNILVLSGGDAHGAFGCGVLAGWEDSTANRRPKFDVVTGVSTGALMATFAFLGEARDDAVLREVYLHVHDKDIFEGPVGGPPDAVFDTAPLRGLIARYVTADSMRRIAAAQHQGRRLYVATVELDTGALFIWPMSRLAAEAVGPRGEIDAAKLERFRKILLAAASIPLLFPPVEIEGGLHVDAGLREALFLRRSMLGIARATDAAPASSRSSPGGLPADAAPTVWAIFNGPLHSTPRPVGADIVHIGIRSLDLYTHAIELLSLREAAHLAAIHDPPYRFRWISEPISDDDAKRGALGPMFDPKVMTKLYESGKSLGASETDPWSEGPPPMEGGGDLGAAE